VTQAAGQDLELSIVMPCLDEAKTVGVCVGKARRFLEEHGISGEVLVADNGSTDGSAELAAGLGARVIHVPRRGYGAALAAGIDAARGRFVLMGDSDDSYDYTDLRPFLHELRQGADVVMGNRFRGGIAPGAMKALHRWFGNPALTLVARLLFRVPCGDVYCGQRAFRKSAVQGLNLEARGMEFALEMLIKATLSGLKVTEVPVTLQPDGRGRPSHLRTFRDGWRSLRLYLQYSPRWLYLYPGLLLVAVGLAAGAWLSGGPRAVGPLTLDLGALLACAGAVVLGAQAIAFGLFGRLQAIAAGLHPPDRRVLDRLEGFELEPCVAVGAALVAVGLGAGAWIGATRALSEPDGLRVAILATAGTLLGGQLTLSGFYMGLLQRQLRRGRADAA
jgi:hypothetical protein